MDQSRRKNANENLLSAIPYYLALVGKSRRFATEAIHRISVPKVEIQGMTTAKDFLCFPGPRRYLYNGDQFMTAMDCVDASWGFAQQYWAQDEHGKWYPDVNGCVMTQVIFGIEDSRTWCVIAERQYALDANGNLYCKYLLAYSGCLFAPIAFDGIATQQSSGNATWEQFDSNRKVVAGKSQVPWRYAVTLDSSGNLDEAYQQGNANELAYWKHTVMQVGRGDIVLTDLLTGTSCKQRL